MKKLYIGLFSLFVFLVSEKSNAQILTFSFAGIVGTEPTVTSSTQSSGVQQSTISRVTVTPSAGQTPTRYNSVKWPTSFSVGVDYLQFTVTPTAGYSLTISSIEIKSQTSNSGPTFMLVRTSANNYASGPAPVSLVNGTENDNSISLNLATSTTPITIRLYAYGGSSATAGWGPGQSVDGNDIQVFGSQIVLPVNLANFKVMQKDKDVQIDWSNLTESNLSYYGIERSANGRDFKNISIINPLKNNGDNADYSVEDKEPLNGICFYRIRAVEMTGRTYFSKVIRMDLGANVTSLSIYPNPVFSGSSLSMQINHLPAGSYSIRIYSAAGQLVRTQTLESSGGALSQELILENFKKGSYLVKIAGSIDLLQRFIVQ